MALHIIININKVTYYPFIRVAYIKSSSSSSSATKDLAENKKVSTSTDDEEGDGEHQHRRLQLLSDGFQTDPRYCGDFIVSFHFFFGGGCAGLSTFYLDEDFHF